MSVLKSLPSLHGKKYFFLLSEDPSFLYVTDIYAGQCLKDSLHVILGNKEKRNRITAEVQDFLRAICTRGQIPIAEKMPSTCRKLAIAWQKNWIRKETCKELQNDCEYFCFEHRFVKDSFILKFDGRYFLHRECATRVNGTLESPLHYFSWSRKLQ